MGNHQDSKEHRESLPASRHTIRNRRSLICVLDGGQSRMALVGFMVGAGSEDSWSLIF